MTLSPDAIFTESLDGTIIHKGTGTADQPFERVFALGADTEAYATADSSEAVALGAYSKAYATGRGARAVAVTIGSTAKASNGAWAGAVNGTVLP
jgi:hypothetical protein